MNVVVLAKSPAPGRVKTRCSPPCTPLQASDLAAAALADTLAVVAAVPGVRRVLALDGPAGSWVPDCFEIVAQRGDGLGERLDHAFADVGWPMVLVGMDTPQLSVDDLAAAIAAVGHDPDGVVVGPATDGGFWCAGLGAPQPGLFAAVAMSRDDTGALLRAEVQRRGRRHLEVGTLTDVDDFATAMDVADEIAGSGFATVVESIRSTLVGGAR